MFVNIITMGNPRLIFQVSGKGFKLGLGQPKILLTRSPQNRCGKGGGWCCGTAGRDPDQGLCSVGPEDFKAKVSVSIPPIVGERD